jgi:hypothetical protein
MDLDTELMVMSNKARNQAAARVKLAIVHSRNSMATKAIGAMKEAGNYIALAYTLEVLSTQIVVGNVDGWKAAANQVHKCIREKLKKEKANHEQPAAGCDSEDDRPAHGRS